MTDIETLTRYSLILGIKAGTPGWTSAQMEPRDMGDFVRYEDAAAALTRESLARQEAERGNQEGWARWLGPDETPLQRIEREFRDCQAVTALLAEERRARQEAETKLAALVQDGCPECGKVLRVYINAKERA